MKPKFLIVALVMGLIGLKVFAPQGVANDAKSTWLTDYKNALETARTEKKAVLMDFTGSDWCGWCIKLRREVFATVEFQN